MAPVALLALAATYGPGCSQGRSPAVQPLPEPDPRPALIVAGPNAPRIANYSIDAIFDARARTIAGRETLVWTNTGTVEVRTLPFHLYMNAFKNEDSLFMKESRGTHRDAKASDDGWGWIDLTSIAVDRGPNRLADLRYPGPDETVAELPLSTPVPPGGTAIVEIEFAVQLPEVFARTGYKGEFTMVGQWFPKIGVRTGSPGQESWHCSPFHLNSEFFADFGTYEVALTVPETLVVAATGVLTHTRDNGDGTRTLSFRAEDVHDFAWMADPYMEVLSDVARTALGEVEVRVYHRPEQRSFARRHLRAGVGAVEQFSRMFLPYPWTIMSIVDPPPDAADGAGGMEYPTLVTTAGDSVLFRDGVRAGELTTIHEVGHNWFQGILASNEVEEAWLDEGVNDWADELVMAEIYGQGTSFLDWHGFTADYFDVLYLFRGHPPATPIDTPSYRFVSWDDYAAASYMRTALAMRTLENITGRDRFRAAMRAYATKFAWRHPTGDDLFDTLEAELGEELDWFVEPLFRGRGSVDFEVRAIDCWQSHDRRGVFGTGADRKVTSERDAPDGDDWACDVVVVNNGNVAVPVEVSITLEDGNRLVESWADRSTWRRFRVERGSPVDEVVIDPQRRVLVDGDLTNNSARRLIDGDAARRAGARGQFWTQTLLQVTGL